uniref:EGF-like domain-containing protein n=1 Tax=Gongylonema pulchrum TaxID=637853 RepID=A0A183CXX0_9BILA
LVNECGNAHLNNCSRFAECIDREDGYECRCKAGYHDNNPAKPGTDCTFIINECESPNLNNCDRHAKCIDTKEGYRCECIPPYNECKNASANDCDKNAICTDTDDGYTCHCKPGFYDSGQDPRKPGRTCIALTTGQTSQAEPTTLSPNLLPCGAEFCRLDRGEVCIGGAYCGCRPEQGRSSPTDKCIPVEKVPIEIRLVSDGSNRLVYSTDYSRPQSQHYVEIVDKFIKDLGATIKNTPFGPHYVTTDVNYITNPKVKNRKEEPKGFPCGAMFCQENLGEVCIAGRLCGCPSGQKRAGPGEKCRPVNYVKFFTIISY